MQIRSWQNRIPMVFWITLLAIVLGESIATYVGYDEASVRAQRSELTSVQLAR